MRPTDTTPGDTQQRELLYMLKSWEQNRDRPQDFWPPARAVLPSELAGSRLTHLLPMLNTVSTAMSANFKYDQILSLFKFPLCQMFPITFGTEAKVLKRAFQGLHTLVCLPPCPYQALCSLHGHTCTIPPPHTCHSHLDLLCVLRSVMLCGSGPSHVCIPGLEHSLLVSSSWSFKALIPNIHY